MLQIKDAKAQWMFLSVLTNIVDLMGGSISVRSEKNKGSEFTVRLSLDRQSKEDIRKACEAIETKSRALR